MRSQYSLSTRLRRMLMAALAAASCAGAFAAPADDSDRRRPVLDPHYGDGLFHFFQERYFTSITGLMVSQHFKRVSHHDDEAEILRGGMLLSYGLHREAGEIFAQLIERGASPKVRDRAWFYLAKIRYQRNVLPEAEDAIARIGSNLPPELEEERGLLQANLLMARGDYPGAAGVLRTMTTSKDAGQYARFNLGVALIHSGERAAGSALLDELGRSGAPNEELRSLRDKANVALGFAALQAQQPEEARKVLERVRLTSLHANKALLGFGWAAASMKNAKQALVPWMELAGRDTSDAAVLEARIAVPYAYAELGAYGQALERYQDAIALFDREAVNLDQSIAAIRAGKLVDGLLEHNPGDEMGWFWSIRALPQMPHAGHLSQVLAQHEFQEAFKNYRDLRFLSRNLQEWQDKLGVFGDMLANRRKAYDDRLPKVVSGGKASESSLAGLQQQRDKLAAELAQAAADADGRAFADPKERDLMARLANVEEILKTLGDDPDFAAARQRARLAAGVLTWQLAQAHPARVWDAQKGLRIADAQLAEARRRDAALLQAQRDEPARFEAFAKRIEALDPRIKALIPHVTALSQEQQNAVQDIAVAELTRQKERLAVYATQARFAVAQLYDRANQVRGAEHAARQ
ncbi:MAG TPA: hypothetical protein VKI18_08635 [Albitalea sp.]|nr:hypothetical protein [Albitalea sp.]